MLVAGELPKDSPFPIIKRELPEATKSTSLWAMKDATRIRDKKNFWVLMEMNIRMWINRNPRLSPTVYNGLQSFV